MWHNTYSRASWLGLICSLAGSQAFASGVEAGLSGDQLQRLGAAMWKKWELERGIAETPQCASVERYLQTICDTLEPHVPTKMAFHAHLDADPAFKSAIALPGGQIVVGVGILALVDSADALAVVIGHEMAHIENGDVDADLAMIERTHHVLPGRLTDLPVDTIAVDHSNDQELAADRKGLTFAVAAGYSPFAAIRLLELFQYMARGTPPRPGALTLDRRIAQMRALIARNGWESLKNRVRPLALPEPS